MLIKNAKIFIGKSFVTGDILFGEKIDAIGSLDGEGIDVNGAYVIPGLVDVHTHGAVGEDFSDGNASGLQPLSDYYAGHGVTSYLATTMTLSEDELTLAMNTLRDFKRAGGAKCAGVHLEGPFLSYAKRGAQAAEKLHFPDVEMLKRLDGASGNKVRLVTVAPEEQDGIEFIKQAKDICAVSVGHTTADYDTAISAFKAGATHVTHLYNGMPSLLHRAPAVIGAAMDCEASVELICDGLHIHPSVIRATFRLFGDKVNLISDSLRSAGMPDGDYELGGQPIVVKNGKATLTDGTLAGSSISLLDAVRNAVRFGIPLEKAVYAATTAPAMAVGLDAGSIEVGKPADLVILDKDLKLLGVYIDGVKFNKA